MRQCQNPDCRKECEDGESLCTACGWVASVKEPKRKVKKDEWTPASTSFPLGN